MISEKMAKSINSQINKEIYSGYLYLSMASYAANAGLKGLSNWLTVQVQEEFAHAQIFYNYMNQQGARVILETIDKPPVDFKSITDVFEKTLEHEKKVTKSINDLVTLAKKENDHASEIFFQWFVSEQVEEEANAVEILQQLKLIGDKGNALFMVDAELAKRVFTVPSPLQKTAAAA